MEISRSGSRTKISRVLAEARENHRDHHDRLSTARRMELAFQLSVEARKFLCAGMKAQGFSEAGIRERLRAKRP